MDDRKIQDTIALLDREVPRAGARIKLHQYGGGPDESQLLANQTGFLRLGIELLKAAFAPAGHRGAPTGVEVDIEYLVTSDSSINFDWFERKELPEPTTISSVPRLVPSLFFASLAVVVGLALLGLVTVIRWLA